MKHPCGQLLVAGTTFRLGDSDDNINNQLKKLRCTDQAHCKYMFNTMFWPGANEPPGMGEFAVVGILLSEGER